MRDVDRIYVEGTAQTASATRVTTTFRTPHPTALSIYKRPPVQAPRLVHVEASVISLFTDMMVVLILSPRMLSRSLSKMNTHKRAKPT